MSKESIYFTGTLLLLTAATLAVPAQESMAGLNDTSINNTTLNASHNLTSINATSNDTINMTSDLTLNRTSHESVLINSAPAADVTLPENATVTVEPAGNVTTEISTPEGIGLEAPETTAFAIGSGRNPVKSFVVNGNAQKRDTFTVGMPIKPVRDVSKMIFVCDIV